MAKRLGIIPQLYAQPLVQGLLGGGSRTSRFADLVEDSPDHIARMLREEELHGALLSPVDYAAQYSHLHILPGVGVISEGQSHSIELIFKEGLRTFSTVAVDSSFSSEVALTRLVLAEKYETTPELVPRQNSLEASLASADAVLLVDRDMNSSRTGMNRIDIIEEWYDMTELPYVHTFWALREDAFDEVERHDLRERSLQGTATFEPYLDHLEYLRAFRYELDEQAISGLTEFLRMAYYYEMLDDLPDVKIAPSS